MQVKVYEGLGKSFSINDPNDKDRQWQIIIQLEKQYLNEYKRNKVWYVVEAWFITPSGSGATSVSLHKNLNKENAIKRLKEIIKTIENGSHDWLFRNLEYQ